MAPQKVAKLHLDDKDQFAHIEEPYCVDKPARTRSIVACRSAAELPPKPMTDPLDGVKRFPPAVQVVAGEMSLQGSPLYDVSDAK
jgi:hypothetical protein